ncbi:MAG: hypothetical protein QOI20_3350, partial [Acidimicrobiaceae bacterium]|nr:hypothetical protein [Acidimicrobiaceae bacterium]
MSPPHSDHSCTFDCVGGRALKRWTLLAAVVIAGCTSGHASTEPVPTTSSSVAPMPAPVPPPPSTTTSSAVAPHPISLDGISMTSVPADLIMPTAPESLDEVTNPINGRRGGNHPLPGSLGCTVDPSAPRACLVVTLDSLGFNVAGGSAAEQDRHLQQAIAVVQLDAGLPMTGRADDALYRYLGVSPDQPRDTSAAEVRTIGTSAQGRPIAAIRYGHGAKTVLVVAETHGDEEGGLRVWLRARTRALPT